jgi:hypothetical protein
MLRHAFTSGRREMQVGDAKGHQKTLYKNIIFHPNPFRSFRDKIFGRTCTFLLGVLLAHAINVGIKEIHTQNKAF